MHEVSLFLYEKKKEKTFFRVKTECFARALHSFSESSEQHRFNPHPFLFLSILTTHRNHLNSSATGFPSPCLHKHFIFPSSHSSNNLPAPSYFIQQYLITKQKMTTCIMLHVTESSSILSVPHNSF